MPSAAPRASGPWTVLLPLGCARVPRRVAACELGQRLGHPVRLRQGRHRGLERGLLDGPGDLAAARALSRPATAAQLLVPPSSADNEHGSGPKASNPRSQRASSARVHEVVALTGSLEAVAGAMIWAAALLLLRRVTEGRMGVARAAARALVVAEASFVGVVVVVAVAVVVAAASLCAATTSAGGGSHTPSTRQHPGPQGAAAVLLLAEALSAEAAVTRALAALSQPPPSAATRLSGSRAASVSAGGLGGWNSRPKKGLEVRRCWCMEQV